MKISLIDFVEELTPRRSLAGITDCLVKTIPNLICYIKLNLESQRIKFWLSEGHQVMITISNLGATHPLIPLNTSCIFNVRSDISWFVGCLLVVCWWFVLPLS